MCQPKPKIIISICKGMVECDDCPMDIDVELHNYDINEIEKDNPDRRYGRDILGDYEIIPL